MAAPRKHSDELRERATRMAVQARQNAATCDGAIARIADQLGVNRELRRHQLLEELLGFLDQFQGVIVEIARGLLEDITSLTRRINDIERRLGKLVRSSHPALLEAPGLGGSRP